MGGDTECREKTATSHLKQSPGWDQGGQLNPLPLFTQREVLAKITLCNLRLRPGTDKLGLRVEAGVRGWGEKGAPKGSGKSREGTLNSKRGGETIYLIPLCARQILLPGSSSF